MGIEEEKERGGERKWKNEGTEKELRGEGDGWVEGKMGKRRETVKRVEFQLRSSKEGRQREVSVLCCVGLNCDL